MNLKIKRLLALLCVAGGIITFAAPTVWAGSASADKDLNNYCRVHAYCNGIAGIGVDHASYNASVLGSDANGVIVVSEYGTCNAVYGDKKKFTVGDGYEVRTDHSLSQTHTINPLKRNTHVYQIVTYNKKEILKIKAKVN